MFALIFGLAVFLTAMYFVFVELRKRYRYFFAIPSEIPLSVELTDSQFIELNDHRIHFVQKGQGPDIILVHGIGANVSCWAEIYYNLTDHFRVTAIDLPGFGQSQIRLDSDYTLDGQAKRLNEFIKKIGIEQTHVLACSMGGTVAAWAAKLEPQLYQKLVLIAPALNPKIARIHPKFLKFLYPVTYRWIVSPRFVRWIGSFVTREPISPEKVWDYYRPFHKNPARCWPFFRSLFLVADPRLPSGLSQLATPFAILWGQGDRITPFKYYESVVDQLPQHTTAIHEWAGHHIMYDDPIWVIEQTKAFINPPEEQAPPTGEPNSSEQQ